MLLMLVTDPQDEIGPDDLETRHPQPNWYSPHGMRFCFLFLTGVPPQKESWPPKKTSV